MGDEVKERSPAPELSLLPDKDREQGPPTARIQDESEQRWWELGQALSRVGSLVDVPEAVQLERTTVRDNNSEDLVRQIMAAQLDRKTRRARANIIIDNSAPLDRLDDKVEQLHIDLMARAGASNDNAAS